MAVSIVEFEKALVSLSEALQFYQHTEDLTQKKIARDACIQRFEFCVELAWKTSGKLMGSSSTAANIVIREMAQNGFISDPELWFDFVKSRNLSSHTYDDGVAKSVFAVIQTFYPHAQNLLNYLKSK